MQRPVGIQQEVLDSLVDIFDPHRESEAVEGYERLAPVRPDELEIRRRQRELQQRDTTRAGRRSR